MKSIRDCDVKDKKVFLRVDFNVPMEDKSIVDDYRIKRSLPTLNYLLERRAKIIIATHLGQPDGAIIPNLSTMPLASDLAKLLKKRVFATDHVIHPIVLKKVSSLRGGEILVLGNLRWHSEEEQNNEHFAKEMSKLADIYVNDAFGVAHRSHASCEAITRYLPSFAGLLLESEITTLNLLLKDPASPFLLILGGAKVKDKLPLIERLAPKVDKILIGGAIGNTFLAATGIKISESLYERQMIEKCEDIIQQFPQKIVLPVDTTKKNLSNGEFNNLDIGPKTIECYVEEINKAQTVFWNGNMGQSEDEKYARGTAEIARAVAKNPGTTIVSGGDTVGFIDTHNLSEGLNFVSTGGGATLQFLGGEPMPAIDALKKSQSLHF